MLTLFGIAREIAGSRRIEWPEGEVGTVGELKDWLKEKYPALSDLRSIRIAVNEEYAEDGQRIGPGDDLVVIPPVAGG
jgi:molybdopterin converting factor subunit 1